MLIDIAISILWLAVGVIVLLGVIYLLLKAFRLFFPVPDKVEQAIYLIAFILILIAGLTVLAGGGRISPSTFRFSQAIGNLGLGPVSASAAVNHRMPWQGDVLKSDRLIIDGTRQKNVPFDVRWSWFDKPFVVRGTG